MGPPIETNPKTVTHHHLKEFPGLHLTFAELPFEKGEILEFVQNYGELTKGVVLVKEIGKGGLLHYRVKSLPPWQGEIQRM